LARTDPTERAAWLAEHCPDLDLRRRVEALLAAHEPTGDLPGRPAATGDYTPEPSSDCPAPPPAAERPGLRIGPYKLLQRLGVGGMGAVWMGEQAEPVKRRAARELLPADLWSAPRRRPVGRHARSARPSGHRRRAQ